MSPHLTLKHALHATLSVIFDVLGCHGDKMLIHKQVVFFFFITLIGLMSLNTHKHAHVIRISISSRLKKKKVIGRFKSWSVVEGRLVISRGYKCKVHTGSLDKAPLRDRGYLKTIDCDFTIGLHN